MLEIIGWEVTVLHEREWNTKSLIIKVRVEGIDNEQELLIRVDDKSDVERIVDEWKEIVRRAAHPPNYTD